MGAAGPFRYDFGAAGLLCGGLIILITEYTLHAGTSIFRPALRRGLARFCLGFLTVTAPVATLFLWYGVLPDLFFDVVVFQAKFYARMRGLPFPGLADMRLWPMAFRAFSA